jgi:hypothetical protein
MNKNTLVVIAAVIILALIGGGAYLSMNKKTSVPAAGTAAGNTRQTNPSQEATPLKSLKDLFLSGISQKCTYSDNTSGNQISGTTYIANGKMRVDSSYSVGGKNNLTHMIVSDNTNYVWTEGQTNGFKMSYDPNAQPSPSKGQGEIDMNKSMNYSCSPWIADNSLFNLPSGIKFSDFSNFMPPAGDKAPPGEAVTTPGQTDNTGNSCGACDNLPEAARTQCRTALHCN